MTDIQTYKTEQERRVDTIRDVRELIDFLEANPAIPIPFFRQISVYQYDKNTLPEITRAMTPCDKKTGEAYFTLSRSFGDTELRVNWPRSEVCERVVVGTKEIPEETFAGYTEEIVEWQCPDSVLRPDDEEDSDE